MRIIIEYDNIKLKMISDTLYRLFSNDYEVILLNNSISLLEKENILKKENNYFLISNKLNGNNNIEIIYPLKENDKIAKELSNKLSSIIPVSKYYQQRLPSKTNLDYYELFQNINSNSGIIIKYNENAINSDIIPTIIYQVINSFLNIENIYIVKSGDSLYGIAKKFNTSVDDIKRINNLTNNLLSIGQKLIIPNENINNTSNNETNTTYIVKSGDSLYGIAKKFNTTVDEIKRINNLTSNLLSIGQKLIIPNDQSAVTYIVQKGDNLYSLSKKYNTTVDKIKTDNKLTSNLLSIGQKLIIKK